MYKTSLSDTLTFTPTLSSLGGQFFTYNIGRCESFSFPSGHLGNVHSCAAPSSIDILVTPWELSVEGGGGAETVVNGSE